MAFGACFCHDDDDDKDHDIHGDVDDSGILEIFLVVCPLTISPY